MNEKYYNEKYTKERFVFDNDRVKVWRAITDWLERFIDSKAVVVDLACGYGDFINQVKAGKRIAVDLNPDFKKYLAKDIKFVKAKSNNLKAIKTRSVDVVFSSNLLEHLSLQDVRKTLKEINRILNKQGRIILLGPNYRLAKEDYWVDPTHITAFDDSNLAKEVKKQGFKIELNVSGFLPLSMINNKLPKTTILTKIYLMSPIKPMAKQMLIAGKKI